MPSYLNNIWIPVKLNLVTENKEALEIEEVKVMAIDGGCYRKELRYALASEE